MSGRSNKETEYAIAEIRDHQAICTQGGKSGKGDAILLCPRWYGLLLYFIHMFLLRTI